MKINSNVSYFLKVKSISERARQQTKYHLFVGTFLGSDPDVCVKKLGSLVGRRFSLFENLPPETKGAMAEV